VFLVINTVSALYLKMLKWSLIRLHQKRDDANAVAMGLQTQTAKAMAAAREDGENLAHACRAKEKVNELLLEWEEAAAKLKQADGEIERSKPLLYLPKAGSSLFFGLGLTAWITIQMSLADVLCNWYYLVAEPFFDSELISAHLAFVLAGQAIPCTLLLSIAADQLHKNVWLLPMSKESLESFETVMPFRGWSTIAIPFGYIGNMPASAHGFLTALKLGPFKFLISVLYSFSLRLLLLACFHTWHIAHNLTVRPVRFCGWFIACMCLWNLKLLALEAFRGVLHYKDQDGSASSVEYVLKQVGMSREDSKGPVHHKMLFVMFMNGSLLESIPVFIIQIWNNLGRGSMWSVAAVVSIMAGGGILTKVIIEPLLMRPPHDDIQSLCAQAFSHVRCCGVCLARPHETLASLIEAFYELTRAIYSPALERMFVLHESEKAQEELLELHGRCCNWCWQCLSQQQQQDEGVGGEEDEGASGEEDTRREVVQNPLVVVEPQAHEQPAFNIGDHVEVKRASGEWMACKVLQTPQCEVLQTPQCEEHGEEHPDLKYTVSFFEDGNEKTKRVDARELRHDGASASEEPHRRPPPLQLDVAAPEAVLIKESDASRLEAIQKEREAERIHLLQVANETLEESMERIQDHRHEIKRLTQELRDVGCKV